jgi:hypothetical protein
MTPKEVHFDNLHYADIAKESYAVFKRLKAAGKVPAATRFQVDLVPAHSVIWLFLVDALHAPVRTQDFSRPRAGTFGAVPRFNRLPLFGRAVGWHWMWRVGQASRFARPQPAAPTRRSRTGQGRDDAVPPPVT